MNDYGVKIAIRPSELEGEVTAPPSKSQTHRALICASLASGISTIYNPLISDDIEATIGACESLGAKVIAKDEEKIIVRGIDGRIKAHNKKIECSESGSTLRFILPIVGISDSEITFTGKDGLGKRPVNELLKTLEQLGSRIEFLGGEKGIPFKIKGAGYPTGRRLEIRGDISSQYISGLLFALPLIGGESEIKIVTDIESRSYVELTIQMLKHFGINIEKSKDLKSFTIKGGQKYISTDFTVEGDYSSSAFLLVAGAISGGEKGVKVNNLSRESIQGDRTIVDILKKMGAKIEVKDLSVKTRSSRLLGCELNASNVPDLVPIIAIAGMHADGITRINGIERLRLKESDRVDGILKMVEKFGCPARKGPDFISLSGKGTLPGKGKFSFNDHRMVMAACVGAISAEDECLIDNPTAIKKSYPHFFDHLRELGGDVMAVSNKFGNELKVRVLGESHGKRIGALIEGVPKGIKIDGEFIQGELEKRRSTSDLTTPRHEPDIIEIVSGIKDNKTTGETIRLEIRNMNIKSDFYEMTKNLIRPGHADFTARKKYGSVFDFRGGGFLSGRMTASLVAAGAIGKKILEYKGIKVFSHIIQVGKIKMDSHPSDEDLANGKFVNSVKCIDPIKAKEMKASIEDAKREGDSLGGIVECRVVGLPVGVGEPIFNSVESAISHAMFSIPAVKGIEFGSGFRAGEMKGSENNDPFVMKDGMIMTSTNNAGGILGGISNGMTIVFRLVIKPTSSIGKVQSTVDISKNKNSSISVRGRHDPCIAIRVPPVVEAMTALTLADLMITGGFVNG